MKKTPILAAAALLAAVTCNDENSAPQKDRKSEIYSQVRSRLALNQGNPLPPPVGLALPFGATARATQHGHDFPSHCNSDVDNLGGRCRVRGNGTLNAVDWSSDAGVIAVAPTSGTVWRSSGDCVENAPANARQACDNRCNSGWGNVVEIESPDRRIFIIGHCDSYRAEAPSGRFVLRGTPVCEIGCTGFADAAHIHFDEVSRNQGGGYTSLGAGRLITLVGGRPTLVRPNNAVTCCAGGSCDSEPGQADCTSHSSVVKPLSDVFTSYENELRRLDPRIVRFVGSLEPDGAFSDSEMTSVDHDIDLNLNGQVVRATVFFWHGSFFLNGNRNPFIDTAFSCIASPGRYEPCRLQTQVHSNNFIPFDLYDFMATKFPESAEGMSIPGPGQFAEIPGWSPDWELWRRDFLIDGRGYPTFLAVARTNRGIRYAIYWDGQEWSEWTGM